MARIEEIRRFMSFDASLAENQLKIRRTHGRNLINDSDGASPRNRHGVDGISARSDVCLRRAGERLRRYKPPRLGASHEVEIIVDAGIIKAYRKERSSVASLMLLKAGNIPRAHPFT